MDLRDYANRYGKCPKCGHFGLDANVEGQCPKCLVWEVHGSHFASEINKTLGLMLKVILIGGVLLWILVKCS